MVPGTQTGNLNQQRETATIPAVSNATKKDLLTSETARESRGEEEVSYQKRALRAG